MYLAIVLLTMLILPVGSMLAEHWYAGSSLILVAGKWFVFWGLGVRLGLAGIRQYVQPSFTAREIFEISGTDALPLIRELGVANFCSGVVSLLSLWRPTFILPMAIIGAIYYGVAGIRHLIDGHRNAKRTIAMVSDLYFAVVLTLIIAQR